MSSRADIFTTIRIEGAILPADLLQRIADGDKALGGLTSDDYHLPGGEKLNEATNSTWNRMRGAWIAFKSAVAKLPEGDLGTTVARERWLLPFFQDLGYGRLVGAKAIEVKGKSCPISHGWEHTPIHLVGCRVGLDAKKAGVAGAARSSPHSLVQEFLNSSDDHLWGFVSNGLKLRILRDNVSLTRQAYVEFDLETMMDGEVYADFVLLWLLCHQSRVEAKRPEECWLEQWSKAAQEQGTRALEDLRNGVEQAIAALGRGFLAHPANRALRDKLQRGDLSAQDFYRQLLRLVYRLLFLFVAEDRDLLVTPSAETAARRRYTQFYSLNRLRRLAERRRGTRHCDLFHGLRLIMQKLGGDTGCPELGLPALGSFLFSKEAILDLNGCELSNYDLLEAVRALAFLTDGHNRRSIDYKNLRSEELGSVYESLLELHPTLNVDAATFDLTTAGGHERKTTGSYYTPESLVVCLLDSALDPVLEEASRESNPESAILQLKVCDPACGSGHFLIAAAHRIAKRLAAVRTGDEEPSPEATRKALRDVIGHCVYGVDQNPMAVELCKVALWMEALEPGKPLSFLDHRVQCGNSLLGATPALLKEGILDEAFKEIEGDDKEICKEYKKKNKEERKGIRSLFDAAAHPWDRLGDLATSIITLDTIDDDTIEGVRRKQEQYESLVKSSGYLYGRLWADAWCASFVWKKTKDLPYPITEEVFRKIEESPHNIAPWMRDEIQRLSHQYQFFHWHLAFSDVFLVPGQNEKPENEQAGWNGGFDVVLGNPPWERTAFEDLQFFAIRKPEILKAPTTAARKSMILALSIEDPPLFAAYQQARREADAENALVCSSGRFPLGASGRTNTYALFTELALHLVGGRGRCGIIVQTGIATDAPMEEFWRSLVDEGRIVSLFDLENKLGIFPGVHRSMKFCLLTLRGRSVGISDSIKCGFFLHRIEQIRVPEFTYSLSVQALAIVNPNTKQPPVCRSQRDLDLVIEVHKRHPILMPRDEGTYLAKSWRALMSAGSSHHYRTFEQLGLDEEMLSKTLDVCVDGQRFLPLIEAKQIHQFDPAFATYRGVSEEDRRAGNPRPVEFKERAQLKLPQPRFWAVDTVVEEMFSAKEWGKDWSIGTRDVTNTTNERTAIICVLPRVGLVQPLNGVLINSARDTLWIVGAINSFALDYVARQKTPGSHLNVTIFSQLPVPKFDSEHPLGSLILDLTLELTYVIPELLGFAQDCGYNGPPFKWNEDRRFLIRCELDAAFFHLYGINRDDVAYIMDTFPIVKRRDEEKFGEYRTKRMILEIYNAMAEATRTGHQYQTLLNPPAADPRVAHPPRERVYASPVASGGFPDFALFTDGAWATPSGVSEDNIALFALLDVLRLFGRPVDPERVRLSAILVRMPTLALPFMDGNTKKQWVRLIGGEAKPLPKNVVPLSRFQKNAVDRPWADAVKQLKATRGLDEERASGMWSAGDRLRPSEQMWIEGRAGLAVRLLSEIDLAQAERNLVAFLEEVEHGATG